MSQRFVFVTGLGIGEDSKGASVEFVTKQLNAHTVIRSGGPQSGHHLVHDNDSICLSHFGAGVFQGVHSHLMMPIIPLSLFKEGLQLESMGVHDPFAQITVDSQCLVVLPFHSAMSRLREILRLDKKGTVGLGVGEAIKLSRTHPELTIRARDLSRSGLIDTIDQLRLLLLNWAEVLIRESSQIPEAALVELSHLQDRELVSKLAESYTDFAALVEITDHQYLYNLLYRPGTIVCESSHGLLHHPRFGFVPHVSQIDPTSRGIFELLKFYQYPGEIIRLGTLRTHFVRFGAGPLVSYDQEFTDQFPELHNLSNDWLGTLRKGTLDLVALKYSQKICATSAPLSGLLLSHLDYLEDRVEWPVCIAYQCPDSAEDISDYFELQGDLITGIKLGADDGSSTFLKHQTRLTEYLKKCRPVVEYLRTDSQSLTDLLIAKLEQELKVPVIGTAHGPHLNDREITSAWPKIFP